MTKTFDMVPFRLAFRREGDSVCAYLARADTMRDARLLGSADIPFLEQAGPEAWPRWRQCMADLFADLMKELLGARPIMPDPVPAPEHERSGRG